MNYAIILAGGIGSRTGLAIPKQFALIGNKPCIAHTIRAFENHPDIDGIILVCHSEHIETLTDIVNDEHFIKIRKIISGGETRQNSSHKGISAIPFLPDDTILIHDAARPFVPGSVISAIIEAVAKRGATLPAIPPADTLFKVHDNEMIEQLVRHEILCAQTPQGFSYSIIKAAHERADEEKWNIATDDAGLVMRAGINPLVVEGSEQNIKITTAKDLLFAEMIIRNQT
ncbi:MAG TPA: 2-C-methyl-D-erythritol 4-phosphate cytidylyltransferase, partial [Spirochaetota bacterium]